MKVKNLVVISLHVFIVSFLCLVLVVLESVSCFLLYVRTWGSHAILLLIVPVCAVV